MGYDKHCRKCPYYQQKHLHPGERANRPNPPVEVEDNGSNVLIVALAPGENEWQCGLPLINLRKKGGTAGSRVQQSWNRRHKRRTDFDIIEAVQCYPGKGYDGRDKRPEQDALDACAGRLQARLEQVKYSKAVALGKDAYSSLKQASAGMKLKIIKGRHPNGGVSGVALDALW